jgi:hypothetical protein
VPDEHEFDERNPFLLVLLGLVSLADEALAAGSGAGAGDPWGAPSPRRDDDSPFLR